MTIFSAIRNAFNSVIYWFSLMHQSLGSLPIVMGVIIAALAVRFLVLPYLKDGFGSDSVNNHHFRR